MRNKKLKNVEFIALEILSMTSFILAAATI